MNRVKTAPTVEPLSFADAAVHLRLDGVDDRAYVERLIVTARRRCEQFLGRAIGAQVQVQTFDDFTNSMTLSNGPVV
ncbi:MAG: head-tail connector protein, partial [Sneathiella sp.]